MKQCRCRHSRKQTVSGLSKLAVLVSIALIGALSPSSALSAQLDAKEAAHLQFMREEEKLAHDVYAEFSSKWGAMPFSNIVTSEARHMAGVLNLLSRFGLDDPAATTGSGKFVNPTLQSLYDKVMKGTADRATALQVGGLIEEQDLFDLKTGSAESKDPDILALYRRLACASRNHLRAFSMNYQAQSGRPYEAQVLSPQEVAAIVGATHERCGAQGVL